MSFTPGPWSVISKSESYGTYIVVGVAKRHKRMDEENKWSKRMKEDDANCRLISVAPDMFDALIEARDMYEHLLGSEVENSESYKTICDVLNKVKGEKI